MMVQERVNLGFEMDNSRDEAFDLTEWEVGTPAPPRPAQGSALKAAEATGFRSREGAKPVEAAPQAKSVPLQGQEGQGARVRRRRTGRNAQFNLKARPDTIQSFCDIADAQSWGLGETLEYAVALLEREYAKTSPK